MSDVENIKARITNVNKAIADINKTNDGNIANKKLLETQFNTGCENYAKKYGVVVDSTNINKVREETVKEKEAELILMEKVTSCISNGDIAQANALMGIEFEVKPVQQVQPQFQPQPQTFKHVPIRQEGVQGQGESSQEALGQQGIPIKPLNTIPMATNLPQEEVTTSSTGAKIMVKVPIIESAEDNEEPVKVAKVDKAPVSMNDLSNMSTGAQPAGTNTTSNINEFMANLGELPKEDTGSAPTSGNALGKGLNDIINGNL